jgi:small redox-active disulfide protein 2
MEIKILGTGCPKCRKLERLTRDVVEESGIPATISKEEDIVRIMEYGILATPGLVVDGKVVVSGRIPSKQEISTFIQIKQ